MSSGKCWLTLKELQILRILKSIALVLITCTTKNHYSYVSFSFFFSNRFLQAVLVFSDSLIKLESDINVMEFIMLQKSLGFDLNNCGDKKDSYLQVKRSTQQNNNNIKNNTKDTDTSHEDRGTFCPSP